MFPKPVFLAWNDIRKLEPFHSRFVPPSPLRQHWTEKAGPRFPYGFSRFNGNDSSSKRDHGRWSSVFYSKITRTLSSFFSPYLLFVPHSCEWTTRENREKERCWPLALAPFLSLQFFSTPIFKRDVPLPPAVLDLVRGGVPSRRPSLLKNASKFKEKSRRGRSLALSLVKFGLPLSLQNPIESKKDTTPKRLYPFRLC